MGQRRAPNLPIPAKHGLASGRAYAKAPKVGLVGYKTIMYDQSAGNPRMHWMSIEMWCKDQAARSKGEGEFKDLLLNFVEAEVDRISREARVALARDVWSVHRLRVRERLLEALGLTPLPGRSPLDVRLIGRLERSDYAVERITYEPRPNFLVPALLYTPKKFRLPRPAVLYACGHWMINGKTEPDIQSCCIGLAKLGFVVLVFDPVGQGERGATFEDHAHKELVLVGLSQEGLMVWESMRAIDYLLTRPEVDGNRIGMTGASGGGLNTLFTCAADERIGVSVPVCYVTSYSRFLRAMRGMNWNNTGDLCNQVPSVIAFADTAGLCGLIAPRPLLVVAGTYDPQFPVAGAEEVVDQVRDVYAAIDPDRVDVCVVESDHGYTKPMREAAYGWFCRWLLGEGDGRAIPEPEHETEPADSATCNALSGGLGSGLLPLSVPSRERSPGPRRSVAF